MAGHSFRLSLTIVFLSPGNFLNKPGLLSFYRTRVRSLAMLVTNSLPNSLTDSCLVNLIDVTLACEDANSKLVEIVTVAGVDTKKLKFSHENKFLS